MVLEAAQKNRWQYPTQKPQSFKRYVPCFSLIDSTPPNYLDYPQSCNNFKNLFKILKYKTFSSTLLEGLTWLSLIYQLIHRPAIHGIQWTSCQPKKDFFPTNKLQTGRNRTGNKSGKGNGQTGIECHIAGNPVSR